mmetsp:Transcript_27326/g.34910  ORF Transcript_27326/g.34910 Transcript_27326/m.34910 type:complete len:140 (+) Transcript_27326:185-604(+)
MPQRERERERVRAHHRVPNIFKNGKGNNNNNKRTNPSHNPPTPHPSIPPTSRYASILSPVHPLYLYRCHTRRIATPHQYMFPPNFGDTHWFIFSNSMECSFTSATKRSYKEWTAKFAAVTEKLRTLEEASLSQNLPLLS